MPRFLIYDGDCPFCSNYVALLNLRKAFPGLQLLNAREVSDHPAVAQVKSRGLLIDDGMALVDGTNIAHGADAIHALACGRAANTLFARINRLVFRSSSRSRLLYPLLRAGRIFTIKMLGRNKLGF